MSVNKLSTELDWEIAAYISHNRLTSLVQVNKYYQTVAEKILYNTIKLGHNDWVGSRRLLLTLVRRPELALLIKHIQVYEKVDEKVVTNSDAVSVISGNYYKPLSRQGSEAEVVLEKETWEVAGTIRDSIDQILINEPCSNEKTRFASILFGKLFTNFNVEWDETLALILCMAKNLESLNLCNPGLLSRDVLDIPWQQVENRSLGRLKKLSLCGCGGSSSLPLVILPTMNYLCVSNWDFGGSIVVRPIYEEIIYPFPKPEKPQFYSIVLDSVDMNFSYVERMVQSPWMANLKTLEMRNVTKHSDILGDSDAEYEGQYDMSKLLEALEEHTPLLEKFQWTNSAYGPPMDSNFDTFQRHKNLKELIIDFDTFTFHADWQAKLTKSRAFFPDSLRTLVLDNVRFSALKSPQHGNGNSRDPVQAIQAMAATSPAKRVVLRVILEKQNGELQELPDEVVKSLRSAADELKESDIVFHIYRRGMSHEPKHKLIIGPDYTAPTQHDL